MPGSLVGRFSAAPISRDGTGRVRYALPVGPYPIAIPAVSAISSYSPDCASERFNSDGQSTSRLVDHYGGLKAPAFGRSGKLAVSWQAHRLLTTESHTYGIDFWSLGTRTPCECDAPLHRVPRTAAGLRVPCGVGVSIILMGWERFVKSLVRDGWRSGRLEFQSLGRRAAPRPRRR